MIRRVTLSSLFFITLFSCTKKNDETDHNIQRVENIVVEDNLKKGISYQSLIEDVKYLTLETTEESLFGNISKICFDDDKIFILDRTIFGGLLVFNDKGKFLFSLKQGGGGEQGFETINSLALDKVNKRIKILSLSSILNFSYDGQFINREKFEFKADNFDYLNDLYAFVSTEYALITSDSSDEGERKYFPWKDNYLLGLLEPFQLTSDGILYRHSLSDTIYLVKNDEIRPHRIIDFQEKKITKPELERIIEVQERKPFPEKMHSIKYYSETESFIYFAFKYQNRIVTSFYDKQSKRINSFFVDEVDNNVSFESMAPLIVGVKDDFFVASIDLEGVNIKSLDYNSNKYLRPFLDECVGKDITNGVYNPMLTFIKFKKI